MKYYHITTLTDDMALEADNLDIQDGSITFFREKKDGGWFTAAIFAANTWLSVFELEEDTYKEYVKESLGAEKGVH